MTVCFQVGKLYRMDTMVVLILHAGEFLKDGRQKVAIVSDQGIVWFDNTLTPKLWEELS